MCGRYTLTRQNGLVDDLEATLDPDAERSPWWKPRFNVAPTQDAPVVTLCDGVRMLEMMRWGLVPFWAGRNGAKPPLMINARVESVQDKPMFRDALQRRRCLVPADGFFEWKKTGKTKQPIWIHPSGERRLFAFAGLWSRAKADAGEVRSFAIVTGPPNELVAPIHDRMPVILDRGVWAAWLDPALDANRASALLGVPPTEGWIAEPVSPWVNAADHDDERCIEPIGAAPPPVQGSLF
jgi:putative SOS response-associated peptidase YedK